MIRISDIISKVISQNALLSFGIAHRLLNLSQVAKFIKPMIEAHTQKEIRDSAILMNLSRYQRHVGKWMQPKEKDFVIENITVQSDLCTMTFFKTKEIHTNINAVYNEIQKRKGFCTITEGVGEITIIFDNCFSELITKKIKEEPRHKYTKATSVGVKFSEKYLETPGLLYVILQQIVLQNINIIELSSTATEFMIYIDQKDTRIAFDTLYNRFSKKPETTT